MTLARSYLTVDETTALLAEELPSTDERRTVFDSLGAADKAVVCRQATRDLDQVPWRGATLDSISGGDQELMFPRVGVCGVEVLPGGELTLPSGISSWSRASIPAAIRRAAAIQAGRNAVRARGFDQARQGADLAHVGVSGRSGGGAGVTVDAGRARLAVANLDPDAARIAGDLMASGAEGI